MLPLEASLAGACLGKGLPEPPQVLLRQRRLRRIRGVLAVGAEVGNRQLQLGQDRIGERRESSQCCVPRRPAEQEMDRCEEVY